jgi:hypothetical protein
VQAKQTRLNIAKAILDLVIKPAKFLAIKEEWAKYKII